MIKGCYPVPPFRKSTDKRARFNWFMYVLRPKEEMVKTLTDRNGERWVLARPFQQTCSFNLDCLS